MSRGSLRPDRAGDSVGERCHAARVAGVAHRRDRVADRRPDAPAGARYARFRGIGTIKRSEFGMTKYVDMVGDTVEIVIATDAWR